MAAYLLPSRHLKADMLSSATSQAGLRPLSAVPDLENSGSLEVLPTGDPSAAVAERIDIVVAGDVGTATFKRSSDAGVTYSGRRRDADWDDGTGDAAGTTENMIADAAIAEIYKPSAPCLVDTDDDGVPDEVWVAITKDDTATMLVQKTTNFSGAVTWAAITTQPTVSHNTTIHVNPLLLSKRGIVYLLYSSYAEPKINCIRSANQGTSWGTEYGATSGQPIAGSKISGCVLENGLLCMSWVQDDGTYDQVYLATSPNGQVWTVRNVSPSTTTNYLSSSVVQALDGTVIVYAEVAGGLVATKTTDKNPADSGASYSSETVSGTGADDASPSACCAPDGTIYVVCRDDTGTKLKFFTRSTAAAYAGPTDAYSTADPMCPMAANIGGAIWCAFYRDPTTNGDALMIQTKYWGTYHATNYPASWTGFEAQYLVSDLWCGFDGSDAAAGDFWTISGVWDYGADLMCLLTPSRPSRSTADGSDWAVVFDFGANVLVPVDTIAVIANVGHLHVQFNASDSWGSPSVNTTVSFDRETAAAYTGAAGKVTRTAGTWTPHQWAGYRLRFGAIGAAATVYYIKDNDETALYVDADLSAASGDLTIMSPRAWATQTKAAYRYMRVLIEAQDTYEEYYEVKALAIGCRTALATQHVCHVGWTVPGDDFGMRTGTFIRSVAGASRRSYVLDMVGIVPAEYQEVQSILAQQGARPLALIPDISNAFDWVPVLPPLSVNWRRPRTVLPLIEVA